MALSKRERKQEEQIEQLEALRELQKLGKVPTTKANKDSSIEIGVHEADRFVFLATLEKHIDAANKTFVEIRRVIKIHASRFDAMADSGGFALFDECKIVHDPRENAREDYNFKKERISEKELRAAETMSHTSRPAGNAKASAELEKAKGLLTKKETELNNRENAVNLKSQELTEQAARLEEREKKLAELDQLLADKEAQLKKLAETSGAGSAPAQQ